MSEWHHCLKEIAYNLRNLCVCIRIPPGKIIVQKIEVRAVPIGKHVIASSSFSVKTKFVVGPVAVPLREEFSVLKVKWKPSRRKDTTR